MDLPDESVVATVMLVVTTITALILRPERSSPKRSTHAFALRNGLRKTPRGLAGTFNGREVEYGFITTNEVERIFFELPIAVPHGFDLSYEIATIFAEKRSGTEDGVMGDDAFDRTFVVRCETEQAAQVWLTQPRRALLLQLRERAEFLTIRDGLLRLEFRAPIDDVELEGQLGSATSAAGELDADGGWLAPKG